MSTRSFVHMLTVAAARLEQTYSNPKLVEALQKTSKAFADRESEAGLTDPKRIGRQRTLMTMVYPNQAKDDLIEAMAQRAYDLMWEGRCQECDALLEFLPSALADKILDAWESDQNERPGDEAKPKSRWYGS